jgi:tRNA (Thr-GGU) A37 N-methylase
MTGGYRVRPIGHVRSSLDDRRNAPRQPGEGAPDAWLVFDDDVREALLGVEAGTDVLLLTWLHRADRTVPRTRPRDDPQRPETGVLATRSPDRPDPVGLHRVHTYWRSTARACTSPTWRRSTAPRSSTSGACSTRTANGGPAIS